MKLAKDDLIAALRLRYDYYSAQTMFDVARERAGLADQAGYDAGAITAFRAALDGVGDRLDRVNERIEYLLDPAGAAARSAIKDEPPKAEAKPEPPEPPVADAKPEKVDAKAEKSDKSARHAEDVAEPVDKPAKPEQVDKPERPDKAAKAGKNKDDDAKPVETTIALKGITLKDGEEVLVCGGVVELGEWDPEKARPMAKKGDEWVATIHVAPDVAASFKFLRRTASGKLVWEDGDDRDLVAKPRIDAVWR